MTSMTKLSPDQESALKAGLELMNAPVEAVHESLKKASAAKAAYTSSETEATKECFKACATDLTEKTKAMSKVLEETSSKTGLSKSFVLSAFKLHVSERDNQRIRQLLIASQSLDLCFVMDATGSMGSHIEGVKDQIRSIIGDLQAAMQHLTFRLSFVAYRDVSDGKLRFQIHEFNGSISALTNFLKDIRASGGRDECEDVLGGLNKAAHMDWKYENKVLFLCADAPCHGSEYHNGCNDDYPTRDFPESQEPATVISMLKQKDVQITFLRLNSTTDKMISEFNKCGACIDTVQLDRGKLSESIKASVKKSLEKTFASSKSKANSLKPRTFQPAIKYLETITERDSWPSSSDSSS